MIPLRFPCPPALVQPSLFVHSRRGAGFILAVNRPSELVVIGSPVANKHYVVGIADLQIDLHAESTRDTIARQLAKIVRPSAPSGVLAGRFFRLYTQEWQWSFEVERNYTGQHHAGHEVMGRGRMMDQVLYEPATEAAVLGNMRERERSILVPDLRPRLEPFALDDPARDYVALYTIFEFEAGRVPSTIETARRLKTEPGFRWCGGMRWYVVPHHTERHLGRVAPVNAQIGRMGDFGSQYSGEPPSNALPDIHDPATAGCLMRLFPPEVFTWSRSDAG